ncbi:hypothetical protein [Glutamicibacter ardleyensis]|uniref:hypothetical protein n=1 Tax=Glutamicibacter ardleyensis TaxID=225894 RepID=UPI003FD4601E
MKTVTREITTSLTVSEIKRCVNGVMGKAQIGPIESGVLDEPSDLEFLAERKGITGHSAVQFYVHDLGENRRVEIVALGVGGFGRALHGIKNTLSLSKSTQWADEIINSLV